MLHVGYALLEQRQSLFDRATRTLRPLDNLLSIFLFADRLLGKFFDLGLFNFLVFSVFMFFKFIFLQFLILSVFVFFGLVLLKFL